MITSSDDAVDRPGDAGFTGRPLTDEEKVFFQREGYVVVPEAVPTARVQAALRAIHASFGKGFDVEPHRTAFRDGLERHPSIEGLLTSSSAWGLAVALVGSGMQVPSDLEAQVLPHFPVPEAEVASSHAIYGGPEAWHIDGMSEGKVCPFSLLVGIALSDTPRDGMGQLVVWPRTHLLLCDFVRRNGEAALGFAAPRPPLSPHAPYQLPLRAGDVVLAHPMLAHGWSVNRSSAIRQMVYFRLSRADHDPRRPRVFAEPFCLYDGLVVPSPL